MKVRIREARSTDTARIAEIHVSASKIAFKGLVPQSELHELSAQAMALRWAPLTLTHDGGFFVAEQDGLSGFCSVTRARGDRFDDHTAEIMAIYVDPDRQSEGIGTMLINAALDHANARGFAEIMLWVLPGNEQARRFYESLGFSSDEFEYTDHGLRTAAPHVNYTLSLSSVSASERPRVRQSAL